VTVDLCNAGVRSIQHRQQGLAKGDSVTHRGSMVESSLAWCRGTQRRGRGGEVPALLLLPRNGVPARLPQMAPGAAPSNGSQCVGGDVILGPASFFPPLASPTPPFLLLVAADQERGKPQTGLACERGLGPGGLCAWSSGARENTRRRALVVRRGEVVDVVTQLWAATSL
jgi:hypothetical protein